MAASESSARITGLGTLIKAGSLAAAVFILMSQYKKYKRKRAKTQIVQQPAEQSYGSYEHDSSSAEKAKGRKIEIESPDLPEPGTLGTPAKFPGEQKRITITSSKEGIEGDEKKEISDISETRSIAGGYNRSPGEMYTRKGPSASMSADTKGPEAIKVPDNTPSSPASEALSARNDNRSNLSEEDRALKEKIAAIDAIGCRAAEGDPEAVSLLFKHVQNEDFHVRQEAVRGILLHGRKEDREQLHETLPAGDWYIMDIRSEDMRKVC